jgi:hypothetical protein
MTHKGSLSSVAAALLVVACTSAQGARESEPPVVAQHWLPTIDHVSPARDAVGAAPTRFEWTAAKDADEYAIGLWDDVDRLLWSNFHVHGTSVVLPDEVELGFGTYYWSVTGMRGGRPIAESGRSAFVVSREAGEHVGR